MDSPTDCTAIRAIPSNTCIAEINSIFPHFIWENTWKEWINGIRGLGSRMMSNGVRVRTMAEEFSNKSAIWQQILWHQRQIEELLRQRTT